LPLDSHLLRLADRFLDLVKRETGFNTIVCDESGTIVRATVQARIGKPHAGSQKIMRFEADEVAITAEDEKRNPLTKEGLNCPILVEGRRLGTFGIAGPLEVTRPLARIASVVFSGWLKDSQQAQRSIANQAELLRSLHDAVIGMDLDCAIRAWNPAAERLFRWKADEVIGRHIGQVLPSEYAGYASFSEFLAALNREGRLRFDVRRQVRDRSWREIEATAAVIRDENDQPAGYVSVNRDVTERKRTEAQMQFTERLAAIGTLAAGVAHEVNNPLAFMVANLGFAREELSKPDFDRGEVADALKEANEGAVRVREIVQALRSFSHQEQPADRPVDVVKVLQSTIKLARNEIGNRARLETDFAAIPPVRASEYRLGQVFLNLLINAAQAITEGDVDRNQVRLVTRLDDARRVVVEVHDTGCGIASGILDRIFDPFFSTKPLGTGSGLGLSVCHGIVTSLGGEIEVESSPGKGSVFRVVLPAASTDETTD
jgi:PAS domain S-box-containing protein